MKEEGDFVGFGREWVIETKRIEGRNTLRNATSGFYGATYGGT